MYHSVLDKYECADPESEAHFAPSPHNFTILNLQNCKIAKISEIILP